MEFLTAGLQTRTLLESVTNFRKGTYRAATVVPLFLSVLS